MRRKNTTLKDTINQFIKMGYNEDIIIKKILHEFQDSDEKLLKEEVKFILDHSKHFYQIQQIMRSRRIYNSASDKSSFVMYDPVENVRFEMAEKPLKMMFHKNAILPEPDICRWDYNPFSYDIIYKAKNNYYFYNSYIPPQWYKDHFYDPINFKVLKQDKMPEIYDRFFLHLVNNDTDSYNYIIDWLVNGIHSKNYCYLVTIGSQGIGKGVLGTIMSGVFGLENSVTTSIQKLTGQFNSQVANKRLIHIDEFSIKSKSEEEIIKMLVNDVIEVEKKGIDAANMNNYANIYFSSNNLDSVKLDEEDRRFSIINLTEKKLNTKFKEEEIKELFDEENINKLGRYLYYRTVDKQKMLNPFISEKTEDVRAASLDAWEDWLIFSYAKENQGSLILRSEVIDAVREKWGSQGKINPGALLRLRNRYPNVLQVVRPRNGDENNRPYYVQFAVLNSIKEEAELKDVKEVKLETKIRN